MTNADDIFGELAAARAYVTRGDYKAALEAIDQATKLWSAERDYWALIEIEQARRDADVAYEEATAAAHSGLARDIATIMAPQPSRPDPGLSEAWLTGKSDVKSEANRA